MLYYRLKFFEWIGCLGFGLFFFLDGFWDGEGVWFYGSSEYSGLNFVFPFIFSIFFVSFWMLPVFMITFGPRFCVCWLWCFLAVFIWPFWVHRFVMMSRE